MSAGLLGAIAGVGPGVTEGLNAKEDRAASKSTRVINEAVEGRNVERHAWQKEFAEKFKLRGMIEDPMQYQQWHEFLSGAGPVAQRPVQGATAPAGQPALGDTAGALRQGIQPLPEFADGGPVSVPTQGQAPAAPQALPAAPQQAAPQPNIPSRRERYNEWYNDTAKFAILNGGLEGYKQFQDMENATSRRQVLGYALQAVQQLDEGNVGEAMRAGNAALEVTPFDTGLKFEAREGKLHMVGKDGKPGGPLTADHLRAFADDHMKTPENYLDWKKQYEVERAAGAEESMEERKQEEVERGALVGERQEDERISIGETNASTMKGHLEIAREKMKPEIARLGAEVISLLQGADADMIRAMASANQEMDPISISEHLRIMNDLIEHINSDGMPGLDWIKPLFKNPAVSLPMQSGAVSLVQMNGPSAVNYADAIALSSLAYGPSAGVTLDAPDDYLPTAISEKDDPEGMWVDYLGKRITIPPHMWNQLNQMSE